MSKPFSRPEASAVHSMLEDSGAATPSRYLVESGQYSFTPELGEFTELNPFEATFNRVTNAASANVATSHPRSSIPSVSTMLASLDAAPSTLTAAISHQPFASTMASYSVAQQAAVLPTACPSSLIATSASTVQPESLAVVPQPSFQASGPTAAAISTAQPPTPVSQAPAPQPSRRRSSARRRASPQSTVNTTTSPPSSEYGSSDMSPTDTATTSPTRSTGQSSRSTAKRKDPQSGHDDDASDEKRLRFLERNRIAASKCRQKKKQWIESLKQQSEEVTQRNKQLNMVVTQLKEEILVLKNQLLAHRDCNCTVIQQYVQRTSDQFVMASAPANPMESAAGLLGASASEMMAAQNAAALVSMPSVLSKPPL
ncbi:hypothetical protein H4R35_007262 [Dimargaris xerosporica]|nr:hypothetical protein H4R35_007262 [Dimargaris xerosporica]